jgi:hypothetical protein
LSTQLLDPRAEANAETAIADAAVPGPIKICFPFLAQVHQAFHSLPIALEIAIRHPDAEVHVAAATAGHLSILRELAGVYAPGAPLIFDQLRVPWFLRGITERRGMALKTPTLLYNVPYFAGFDALVVPERTSLVLRNLLKRTRMIWTRHGAGDRASGFTDEIRNFDFVLMSGCKIEQRLRQQKLIEDGHYETGIYAKFDLVERLPREPLFANDRKTILYNPHFWLNLSSWPVWGEQVLEFFAASDCYNFVFAPHIRLFDPPTAEKYEPFERYAAHSNMRIDLGSLASADMTYTLGSDLYLGDVSSQVAEFLKHPRPCVFLNAHHVDWRGNANYRFWELGPVVEDIADLGTAIEDAFRNHELYRGRQIAYLKETFERIDEPSAPRAADAIVDYLRREGPRVA